MNVYAKQDILNMDLVDLRNMDLMGMRLKLVRLAPQATTTIMTIVMRALLAHIKTKSGRYLVTNAPKIQKLEVFIGVGIIGLELHVPHVLCFEGA